MLNAHAVSYKHTHLSRNWWSQVAGENSLRYNGIPSGELGNVLHIPDLVLKAMHRLFKYCVYCKD